MSLQIRSLQTKIMLWSGLSLLIVAAVLIGYAAVAQREAARQTAEAQAIAAASADAGRIQAEVEVALDTARALAQALSAIKQGGMEVGLTRAQVNAMLRQTLALNPQFLGVYTLWEPNAFDGQDAAFVDQPGHDATGRFIPYWVRADDAIIVEPLLDYETAGVGDYYQCPKLTRQECIIDPYLYPINGVDVLLTSVVVPIMADGQFYGMAGVDLPLDFLQTLVDEADIFNKAGTLTVISHSGLAAGVTGHPEQAGHALLELREADFAADLKTVQAGATRLMVYDDFLEVYVPIKFGLTTTPWSANLNIPMTAILAEATRSMLQMIAVGVALTLAALGLLGWLARQLARPIRALTAGAQLIAAGDLSQPVTVRQTDEIGQLADAFRQMSAYLQTLAGAAHRLAQNDLTVEVAPQSARDELGNAFVQMVANLRTTVGEVTHNAQSVNTASGQLAAAAGQAGQATSQIATTIQQIAKGTQQQAAGVTQTASALEQMKRTIDSVAQGAREQAAAVGQAVTVTAQLATAVRQVAGNAQAVTRDSAGAAEAARAGAKVVGETIQGMAAIKTKVGASAAKVKEMGRRSDQVGAIVETIDDIASQTNLLALNAAIEAARAGEHGQGFAVVADEVRKLAEKSAGATKEIGGLIRGIQTTVGEAVRAMDEGAQEVESGAARANEAGQALTAILQAAQAVNHQAQAALQASEQMGQLASDLVTATDAVSVVVQQNTAATADMAAHSAGVTQAIE
nr:HAMP domain-containing protein [Anaerolineales bacterium]